MKFETLLQALEYHAETQPDKLLIADGERELSYAQFLRAASGFACYLRKQGCKTGDIVAVQNTQSAVFAVAAFGAQIGGYICLPLDGDASETRVRQILELTNARFAVLKNGADCGVQSISQELVLISANGQKLCKPTAINPDSVSEILFTTGTTGASKGVMHTYRSELACAENQVHSLDADGSDVWLIPMPLSHAMGLRKLHGAILSGGTAVTVNGVAFAGRFFEALERYRITILSLVPAYLNILLRLWSKELGRFDSQLKCIRLGSGAATRQDLERLAEALPDVTVCICYGSSEASDCAYHRYRGRPEKPGCVGTININAQIRLLDDEGKEIAAPGVPGRIELSGANLMSGYFGEPELNARVLKDGRLASGDVGYFDSDGLLYLLGRADEVINSGGYKISPDEVEEAARKIDGIADCACISAPDPVLGQIPLLAVVMQKGRAFSAQTVYQALAEHLERHLLPRTILEINTIPRTASGKPQRAILKKQLFPEE